MTAGSEHTTGGCMEDSEATQKRNAIACFWPFHTVAQFVLPILGSMLAPSMCLVKA